MQRIMGVTKDAQVQKPPKEGGGVYAGLGIYDTMQEVMGER